MESEHGELEHVASELELKVLVLVASEAVFGEFELVFWHGT